MTAPGPPQWPFAALRAYRRDPLGYLSACARRYGGLVHLRMAHKHVYVLNHPDPVEHVLVTEARRYRKGVSYTHIRHVTGQGLLGAEGDVWRAQRRLMQPFHSRRSVLALVPAMAAEASLAAQRMRAAGRVELYEASADTALRVIARTLLGLAAEAQLSELRALMPDLLEWGRRRLTALVPTPLWVPTNSNRRYAKALARLNALAYRLIESAAEPGSTEPQTLLQGLLAARDDRTNHVTTTRQVRDEVVSHLLAGHETSASALSWILFELARRPKIRAQVRSEIAGVAGCERLTAEHVPQLELTRRVLNECMRLNPPTWAYTRHCQESDTIGEHTIERGGIVLLCQYTTHRNPDVWEAPQRFDPNRFLPEQVAARPRFAFFPFGGGQHQCIGGEFAMLELTVLTAELIRSLEFTLVDPSQVVHEPGIALNPKHGVWVDVARRAL